MTMENILSKKKWLAFSERKNLSGKNALAAVKKDGYALQYVKEEFLTDDAN